MRILLMSLLAVATLGGCATSPTMTTQDRFNLYVQHAGPPVQSFQLTRFVRHTQWTPLGDRALAIWTSSSRGHLLELRGRCTGLSIAHTVQITNSFGTVSARWDSVIPRTMSVAMPQSCRIIRIRPLDGTAIRDARREMRNTLYGDRPADVVEDTGPDVSDRFDD
ncbi:DUF6491 family protein [Stenotrophomonas sp.]|uniref:DUF6491 family protein n=1 Tax=Stenotrophomonas sp. TaxID=69392 RepID=UPI0028ACC6FB|nr:DUF6491 family protein [Stenotrophomonas sp.]